MSGSHPTPDRLGEVVHVDRRTLTIHGTCKRSRRLNKPGIRDLLDGNTIEVLIGLCGVVVSDRCASRSISLLHQGSIVWQVIAERTFCRKHRSFVSIGSHHRWNGILLTVGVNLMGVLWKNPAVSGNGPAVSNLFHDRGSRQCS